MAKEHTSEDELLSIAYEIESRESVYRRVKPYFLLFITFFVSMSTLVGIIFASIEIGSTTSSQIVPISEMVVGLNKTGLEIFIHNFRIGMSIFVSGLIIGAPVVWVFFQAIHIGVGVSYLAVHHSLREAILAVISHGPVEIISLCLYAVAGFRLGLWVLLRLRTKTQYITPTPTLKTAGIDTLYTLLFATILLACAALIEVTITPILVEPFLTP